MADATDKSVMPYASTYTPNPLRGKSPPRANSWRGDVETPAHQMNGNLRCLREHLESGGLIKHSNTVVFRQTGFPELTGPYMVGSRSEIWTFTTVSMPNINRGGLT